MKTIQVAVTHLTEGKKINHPKHGVQEIKAIRHTDKKVVIMFGEDSLGNWKHREYKSKHMTVEMVVDQPKRTQSQECIETRNQRHVITNLAETRRGTK